MASVKAANMMSLALRDHVLGLSREKREAPASGRSFWSLFTELRCEDEDEPGVVLLEKLFNDWPLEGCIAPWGPIFACVYQSPRVKSKEVVAVLAAFEVLSKMVYTVDLGRVTQHI